MTERTMVRSEDDRFLTGRGRFTDNLSLPGQAHAYVLRSPHAHAAIRSLDTGAAPEGDVLAVLTGRDWAADGLGSLPCILTLKTRGRSPFVKPPHPALAAERVRHVGDPVALVVAETPEAARDAAERIVVDYEPLPAVTDTAAAALPGAPGVWEEAPGNLCFDWETGDGAAVDAAFAKAAHVTRLGLAVPRLAVCPIETRAAIGAYDAEAGRYTLHTPSQGVHMIRDILCDHVFQIPRERMRVLTGDVGGAFGIKLFPYPEQALVLWAARRTGRPVKWTGERGEAFMSDCQARDHVTEAALALAGGGRFLALRLFVTANLGAYLSAYAPGSPTEGVSKLINNTYVVPDVHVRVHGVFTNTVSVEAYRGAGKPEALYVVERLVERAAHERGIDPVALRRLNLVPADAMPYRTATGLTYDSCDFAGDLDMALERSDWDGFAARRERSAARGKLRGIGLSCYMHAGSGMPGDMAAIVVDPNGAVLVRAGTQATGQGHETTLAQVVAERLGISPDAIRVDEGDSDALARGAGSGGSGTLLTSGVALVAAAEIVVDKGRRLAAHLLEAAPQDIAYADGAFTIVGTDRRLGLFDAARAAAGDEDLPEDLPRRLDGEGRVDQAPATFPSGCQVSEVEVDPETGAVRIVRHVAVDDYGRIVNRAVVEGQVHGALAQGIGPALMEACRYDPQSGQLLTGSFMDYCLPRADDLPSFEVGLRETPTATNPLGVKSVGEVAANGAAPAVINALLDALRPLGVEDIPIPATSERVWRAITEAKARGGG